jgi:hypothetical protein
MQASEHENAEATSLKGARGRQYSVTGHSATTDAMMLGGGGARTDRALDGRVVDADHRVSVNEAVGEQLAALFLQELAVIEHNEVDSPARR